MTISTITMLEAERMIRVCYEADEPLFLIGSPGMGKTALFTAVAKALDIGYIANILSQKDPVDVAGMRVPNPATGTMVHYVPEDLPVEPGKGKKERDTDARGILHYDEINTVSMLMQATAYGIINERRVGLKKLKAGWVPMASGNLATDRSAAQRLSLALANRFNIQQVVPDHKSWLAQYASQHVDTRGCAFIRFRPELFHKMPDDPSEVRFPSARSWTKAFKFIDEEPTFRRKIFAGYVGDGAADEFEAFWRIMSNAVTFDEIIDNPTKARVPAATDVGTLYAMTGMISRELTRQNLPQVMKYVNRLPTEFQVALLQDATKRDTSLRSTTAYGAWAVDKQGLLL